MAKTRPPHVIEQRVCRYLKPAPTAMYDIGVGGKSEWRTMRKRYTGLNLYGCEPHPGQYARLRGEFPGPLLPVAIGEAAGRSTLHTATEPMQSSLFPRRGATGSVDVEVWTLDRFDEWAGKPDRVLLWMDIEGSELRALCGGMALLESRRVVGIVLEVRDAAPVPGWATTGEIDSHLAQFNYRRTATVCENVTHRDVVYTRSE